MTKVDWLNWEAHGISSSQKDRGFCRTCHHGEYWHLNPHPACNYNLANNAKTTWTERSTGEILIPRINKQVICPCLRYVPGDNLAYLEWLDKNNGE